MDAIRDFLFRGWIKLAAPLVVLGITLAVGYGFKRFLFRLLRRWVDRTKSPAAHSFAQALDRPFMIWVLILGVHLASQSSELSERAAHRAGVALLILWVISLTIMFAGLARDLIRYYGNGIAGALPVTSLTQHLAQLSVVVLGIVVLLNLLGIPITPILTFLGVGGLAVALALQDTLSNLFAGFYVAIAGQVRLGDYIKLSTGEEGYVTDINWRSTSIRPLPNNLIIIPNSKLAQAIVTNFHLPEKRMSLVMPVSVAYGSDPEQVERVLVEVATQGARDIPGLLAEPAPFVRFIPGFGASSLDFSLICQVAEFVDQFLVQHELRKRIVRRFRAEGIEIPFPTRTLYMRGQGA